MRRGEREEMSGGKGDERRERIGSKKEGAM